ncbi:MAG: methyltransferase domain-containing protein, partial [Xanthomonadales bacterium]|nr:methyltransferase domain-containing protein [Xanthomonadales bacterium]
MHPVSLLVARPFVCRPFARSFVRSSLGRFGLAATGAAATMGGMDNRKNPDPPDSAAYRSHRRTVAAAFDRAAGDYDRHAALEQEVGRRLLERCAFSRREPQDILDLGCGTGAAAEALKQKYRRARVVGLDLSQGMLKRFARRSRWLRPLSAVRGDITALPIAGATADLVFANLSDPWVTDRSAVFEEY